MISVRLRENRTAPCGGDPETSPVVDRYRIYRASGKIERLNRLEIIGSVTTQRKSDSARGNVTLHSVKES